MHIALGLFPEHLYATIIRHRYLVCLINSEIQLTGLGVHIETSLRETEDACFKIRAKVVAIVVKRCPIWHQR